jgi:predicted GIY-YIG superfamily endonuclease
MMCAMAYVYIYRSGDSNVFKIGKATDLEKRLKTHATGNPEPLTRFDVIETEHASKCETYLHHRLRSKQSRRGEGTEWFEVDPEELAPIIEDARHYAEEVLPKIAEAERLAEELCDDRILQPSGGVLETYGALVKVRERYDSLGFQKDLLEAELKLTIGTASGIERVANWKSVLGHRLDTDALRGEQPDLYAAFLRETRTRRFTLL